MPDTQGEPVGGSRAAAISNLVVRLVCEYTGRGPTKAKTYLQDDLVTVVLQDGLTKGEQSLIADGEQDVVLTMRKTFQKRMQRDFTSGVERITGRRVIAFVGGDHLDPDITIESFVLAPDVTDGDPPISEAVDR